MTNLQIRRSNKNYQIVLEDTPIGPEIKSFDEAATIMRWASNEDILNRLKGEQECLCMTSDAKTAEKYQN